jgi:predicted dehydrogenase
MKDVLVMGLHRGAALAGVAATSTHLRLAGAIDPDEQALRSIAAECRLPDSKLFKDFPSAVAACDAQILVVATPNHLHAKHVSDGLAAGLHVLCEKPLATRRDEALMLRDQSRRHNRQLAVIQNYRFGSHFRRCRELIEAGEVGPLLRASFDFGMWRQTARLNHAHPLLFNHGVHHVDLLRYVTGEVPRHVHALEWDPPHGGEGKGSGRVLRLTVTGVNGCVICYDGSYADAGTMRFGKLTVNGTRGTLEAFGDFEAPELWLSRSARATGEELRRRIDVPPTQWLDIDRHLLESFAHAIDSGQRIETDIEDNLQTLEWLFRAAEVIDRGTPSE